MNPVKSHLIAICAPSGAGKTTLCQKLLEDFPTLTLSISSTTRKPRGSEKNGLEYFFISPERFQAMIQDSQFAEWALVHGNYYGTSKEVIRKAFDAHRSVLLDIDVQGANQLKASFPEECHRIFIAPPSLEILETRLRARKTDPEEAIMRRLKNAQEEILIGNTFEHIIINDSLDRAYAELKSLLVNQFGILEREGADG